MRLIYLLGLKELSPPPLNLKRLYKETLEIEPILIIISPGADPSQELQELANAERSGECYHQVSAHYSAASVTNPMDFSLPGSSVHGIFQARMLEYLTVLVKQFFVFMVGQLMSLKIVHIVHILIPRTHELVILHGRKNFANIIKHFEMERLSEIIQLSLI